MQQRIEVFIQNPESPYGLEIKSVYLKDNVLQVIAEFIPNDWIVDLPKKDAIFVETAQAEILPVNYFVIDAHNSNTRINKEATYVETYSALSPLFENAECCYVKPFFDSPIAQAGVDIKDERLAAQSLGLTPELIEEVREKIKGAQGREQARRQKKYSNYRMFGTSSAESAPKTEWQIIAGGNHSFIFHSETGTLYGFGRNSHGELGLGHKNEQYAHARVSLPGGDLPAQVAAGYEHTIILSREGHLYSIF